MRQDNDISVIIAAAGNAVRFGQNISKQFILLDNKPLLLYSLEKFFGLEGVKEIIIASNDVDATSGLLYDVQASYNVEVKIVIGGNKRQDSVYNAFCKVDPTSNLVLIHDVARPLFSLKDAKKCIEEATICGAATLAVPIVDTIKKGKFDKDKLTVDSKPEGTLNREGLYLIQTPQVFRYHLLSCAYKAFKSQKDLTKTFLSITDEARMVEVLGKPVNLVIGTRTNIKITYKEDLEIAAAILKVARKEKKQVVLSANS